MSKENGKPVTFQISYYMSSEELDHCRSLRREITEVQRVARVVQDWHRLTDSQQEDARGRIDHLTRHGHVKMRTADERF